MDLHTVISFIDENNGQVSYRDIKDHFEDLYLDIRNILREGETTGLLYRRNYKDKEMWYT